VIKVYTSSVIVASADAVWAHIRDFNGLPKWHPAIAESRIEGNWPDDRVGCIRNFQLRDGGTIREQLLTLSDSDYQWNYSLLESPMGVDNNISPSDYAGRRRQPHLRRWSAEFDRRRARNARWPVPSRPGRLPDRLDSSRATGHREPMQRVTRSAVIDAPIGGWAGAARLQQPRPMASAVARSLRERRGARRVAACAISACGRRPYPRAADRAVGRPGACLDLLHPRRHSAVQRMSPPCELKP
jgi:hypothetical protein